MKILPVLLLPILSVTSVFSQYCTNVGPSSTIDSNVESVQITGAVGAINFTGCPGVVGLQDLTASQTTTLNAGMSYTISVKYGTCGGYYSGAGTVWIDYNANYIFETTEIVGTWQGTPPAATQIYNFTVPAGAQNGFTRMRITQQEGTSLPLNPCATFTWGSVMDFGITIGNGVDCTGYIGDDTDDPIIVSSLPYSATADNSYCYSNQNLVYPSPDIYYEINPSPLMQSINVSLCGSSFDTFLSVIDVDGNVIAFNDDADGCGTSSELTFETEGLGTVYIIVEGWGSTMGEFDILINANYLDLNELDEVALNLYPNPSSGNFYLSGVEGEISIHDLSGKLVLITNILSDKEIDVKALNDGMYMVKFNHKGIDYSRKLILRR